MCYYSTTYIVVKNLTVYCLLSWFKVTYTCHSCLLTYFRNHVACLIIVSALEFLLLKTCWHLQKGLDDDSSENYRGGLMAMVLEKDASLSVHCGLSFLVNGTTVRQVKLRFFFLSDSGLGLRLTLTICNSLSVTVHVWIFENGCRTLRSPSSEGGCYQLIP